MLGGAAAWLAMGEGTMIDPACLDASNTALPLLLLEPQKKLRVVWRDPAA